VGPTGALAGGGPQVYGCGAGLSKGAPVLAARSRLWGVMVVVAVVLTALGQDVADPYTLASSTGSKANYEYVGLSVARPDLGPLRIVSAVMVDENGDFRADRVRLTYSRAIRHAADSHGHYPFAVAGYRIRSVGAAAGKSLLIVLAEKKRPDSAARPTIRYRRTTAHPVTDLTGAQALAQLFRATRPHRHVAPAAVSATSPAPTQPRPSATTTTPSHPSCDPNAPDLPDLSFVDSNCDGLDGTEADAIFVSPNGDDANPGSRAKPKREIQAAIDTVKAGEGRYVLAAAGTYKPVQLASGVSVYGGYDPNGWSRRSASLRTAISGSPQGILADAATRVVLQLLTVAGEANGPASPTAYGIRAIDGSALTLQRVTVTAGPGVTGVKGGNGGDGGFGARGEDAGAAHCTLERGGDNCGGLGGANGWGVGRGGDGGHGGEPCCFDGRRGGGPNGGAGGKNGDTGKPGGVGGDGVDGPPGRGGSAGAGIAATASRAVGAEGGTGIGGAYGGIGGGGGGGGGQPGIFSDDNGNGGGGGGGAGGHGFGGIGGTGGGGSFGIYLYDSILIVDSSSVTAGSGGPGGAGGNGGLGGNGGDPGHGASANLSNVGRGGDGGRGGNGGPGGGGGGGAGGPSIGIFKGGTSTATVTGSTIEVGTGGAGGAAGGPSALLVGHPAGIDGEAGKPGVAAKISPQP